MGMKSGWVMGMWVWVWAWVCRCKCKWTSVSKTKCANKGTRIKRLIQK